MYTYTHIHIHIAACILFFELESWSIKKKFKEKLVVTRRGRGLANFSFLSPHSAPLKQLLQNLPAVPTHSHPTHTRIHDCHNSDRVLASHWLNQRDASANATTLARHQSRTESKYNLYHVFGFQKRFQYNLIARLIVASPQI